MVVSGRGWVSCPFLWSTARWRIRSRRRSGCVHRPAQAGRGICPGRDRRSFLPDRCVRPGVGKLLPPLAYGPLPHTFPRWGCLGCVRRVRRLPGPGAGRWVRGVCLWSVRDRSRRVRGLALGVRLVLPLLNFLALLLDLGHRHGNTPPCNMAYLNGASVGGLLHLLHGLGAAVRAGRAGGIGSAGDVGDIVGYLGGGASPVPLTLDQLFFQLGRHDTLGLPLSRPATLIGLIPFFNLGHDIRLLKK